ncbi:hypothetical protein GNI_160530 [Gregarina niphandrodes]|uniref:Uncharacterized protein n=1 Tax=Gregarina niphandrodes TaxID=110365 RepID=A0A023AYM4_GRENI|nr:hypothetical protein GNI_160530 [Gregarina niphandrodes]EZG43749.1 hypothetical protein GNI_160530 [Gregarina niphandrodes]|eukprot:XP_011134642.1 hypothetical protein GNI_160530 [Gregarina niphandrodes]
MNVLPESWFAWQAESVPDWATDSGCPSSLRSPAAVAYWAYYLDTKDSFTPEQRLWHLSVLARWSPGHALIHAFSDMKEHFQSIRDDREDQSTQDLQQALNFWLCKDNGGTLEQVVTKEFNDAAAQLKAIRNDATNSAMKPYESLLGKWCISTGWEESKSYHDYYHLQCPMYRDQIVSTYFSDLVCWPVEEGTKRFPVASFNSFAFDRPRDIWLRYAVRLEEQFVRRLVDLLIDHQAIGTGLTRDTIIKNLRHQKSFRFSASQNTFNQLYNQALNEKIKQVSIERGFDRAWKLGCAAITTMYDISAVANAPVVAQLKGLENPAAPSSF